MEVYSKSKNSSLRIKKGQFVKKCRLNVPLRKLGTVP